MDMWTRKGWSLGWVSRPMFEGNTLHETKELVHVVAVRTT